MIIYDLIHTIIEQRRQTGRTTRMMKYVITKVVNEPHRYFIVGAQVQHMHWLADHFLKVLQEETVHWEWNHHTRTYSFGQGEVTFVTESMLNEKLLTGIVDRLHDVKIEDHYTIECRIADDLKELDRWWN